MRILFVGDIVARAGREVILSILPKLRKEKNIDFVIANADNMTHGRGSSEQHIRELLNCGVDIFTGGDHLFYHESLKDSIDSLPVVRPANYPDSVPGVGYKMMDLGEKGSVLVISLMGRTFLNERLNDPFTTVDKILEKHEQGVVKIVDFHAEATSEKYALGFYLDGRVNAVLGTHTHVPTCDNFVLPLGTMFVSDVGMTGIIDSVLGVKKDIIIEMYLSAMKQRFEWENTGRKAFRSVILDTDEKSIERFDLFDVD